MVECAGVGVGLCWSVCVECGYVYMCRSVCKCMWGRVSVRETERECVCVCGMGGDPEFLGRSQESRDRVPRRSSH